MTDKVETLLQKQSEAVQALKEGLEERDKKLSGAEEKVEAANKAISDIEAKLKETAEAQAKRADDIEAAMNRLELSTDADNRDIKAEALRFYAGKSDGKIKKVTDEQVKEYRAYEKAFNEHLRFNPDHIDGEVKAALKVGSDPDGGYTVPASLEAEMTKRLFETSDVRRYASVQTISTDHLEILEDINDATSGGWVGELESRAETATPQLQRRRIFVHEQYAEPRASQKILDDSNIDIESWLVSKTVDKMMRTENTAFVTGSGSNQPHGFLASDYTTAAASTEDASRAWGVVQEVYSGASGDFGTFASTGAGDTGPLIDLIHKMKSQYRNGAVFAGTRLTVAALRKLRDADGNLIWQQSLQVGQPSSLLGYPVVEMEDIAEIGANSYSLAFANFGAAYQIVDRIGTRLLRDPFTAKPEVKFYITRRTGGDLVNFDAIKYLKFGTS